jgi:hypothetical protein
MRPDPTRSRVPAQPVGSRNLWRAGDAEIIELPSLVLPNARWISGTGGSASSIRTPLRHAPVETIEFSRFVLAIRGAD